MRARKRKCPTNKVRFRDHRESVKILHAAQNARTAAAVEGTVSRRREVRDYECPHCSGVHVTSQPIAA